MEMEDAELRTFFKITQQLINLLRKAQCSWPFLLLRILFRAFLLRCRVVSSKIPATLMLDQGEFLSCPSRKGNGIGMIVQFDSLDQYIDAPVSKYRRWKSGICLHFVPFFSLFRRFSPVFSGDVREFRYVYLPFPHRWFRPSKYQAWINGIMKYLSSI